MSAAATEPAAQPRTREAELEALALAFKQLMRTLNSVRGRDTHLPGGELTHAQFELLLALQERGELSAAELAASARLAPGSVTQMLDHLAERGHVRRVRSPADRRVVVSRLTAQGSRAIARKRAAWQARWEAALAQLPASELAAARGVMERLEEMLEAGASEPVRTRPQARREAS